MEIWRSTMASLPSSASPSSSSSASSSSSSSSSSFPPLHSTSSQVAISRAPPCSRASFSLHRQPFNPPLVIHTVAGTTRSLSILLPSRAIPRAPLAPRAIHSSDPDFYKIPYVEGIPVGKKLKLWNLPLQCKKEELLEWFDGVKVRVESLQLVAPENLDPTMQGISGFVEFETKQDACIAIIRLDGAKFRGHYIRMDFAEKRPHSKDYGSRRNRSNNSGRNRPSANTSTGTSTSTSTTSSAAFPGSTTIVDTTLTHVDSSNSRGIETILSTGITSSSSSSYNTNNTVDAPVSDTSSSYVQNNRGSSIPSSHNTSYKGNNLNYNSSNMLAQQGPGYGTSRSDEGFGNKMRKESINGNQVNAYNGSHSVGQNERFGDAVSQETIGNRRIQEEIDGNYLNANDSSNATQTDARTSYVYGPMYGSPQPSSPHRLFVGNMDLCIDDASLQQIFSEYGTVLEARVLKENGQSRGFAVIAMSSVNEVEEASRGLDGRLVGSRYIKVASVAS